MVCGRLEDKASASVWLSPSFPGDHLMGIGLMRSSYCRMNETSSKIAPAKVVRIDAADEECRFPGRGACMTLAEYWYSADAENQAVCESEQGWLFSGVEVEGAVDCDVQLSVGGDRQ